MKRKAFIFLLAGVTFMSAFGGVAVLLEVQQNQTPAAPVFIAIKPEPKPTPTPITIPGPDLVPNGNSWGG